MEFTPPRRPGAEVRRFKRDLEDLWNRYLGEPLSRRFGLHEWSPYVDVSETDQDIIVRAELPGLDAEDIDLNVSDQTLTIRGNKTGDAENEEERAYASERYFGPFERNVHLPTRIQDDKVDARFKSGVLLLRMAKAEQAKRKKIEIKTME